VTVIAFQVIEALFVSAMTRVGGSVSVSHWSWADDDDPTPPEVGESCPFSDFKFWLSLLFVLLGEGSGFFCPKSTVASTEQGDDCSSSSAELEFWSVANILTSHDSLLTIEKVICGLAFPAPINTPFAQDPSKAIYRGTYFQHPGALGFQITIHHELEVEHCNQLPELGSNPNAATFVC
jgi:hypothetical protein